MAITDGNTVKVDYKGTLADGEVFDSSEGKDPISFKVGDKQVIPGFEDAVRGMKKGESKKVTIPADNAYGQPRDELVQEVPKERLPEGVKEGMVLGVQLPNGQQVPARVVKVTDKSGTIDLNHPLAGKDLTFEITVVDVSE